MSRPISGSDHANMVRQIASSQAASRSAIAASWRRSLLHHGLRPEDRGRRDLVTQNELHSRREAEHALITAAAPMLDRLAAAVAATGNALLLGSADGLIVDERLGTPTRDDFLDLGLTTGARWAEADEGTNGIGTALAERRAVLIWRDQHFHARNLALVCMSAPIDAPDGGVAGVIDISSCRADMTEGYARLIATMVQDAATRIGCELFRGAFPQCRIVAAAAETTHGPCLVAVDDNDLVLAANRAACRALGLDAERLAQRPPAGDIIPGEHGVMGLDQAQRAEILRALRRADGSVTKAARALGIGRSTLYRKIQDLGIRPDG